LSLLWSEDPLNKHLTQSVFIFSAIVLLAPCLVLAQTPGAESAPVAPFSAPVVALQQGNVPADVQRANDDVERTVRRLRIGVQGGVGVDPELLMFGAHGAFGPLFRRGVDFRPGIEFGVGELTTMFGINLDVLYTLPGLARDSRWTPYVGAGPNFALSHQGLDSDEVDDDDQRNRFDFSDTDFDGGFNFIAGARHRNGMFLEMKATAYGVSNVRLLVGFNF
jgi:hypothetical protein